MISKINHRYATTIITALISLLELGCCVKNDSFGAPLSHHSIKDANALIEGITQISRHLTS